MKSSGHNAAPAERKICYIFASPDLLPATDTLKPQQEAVPQAACALQKNQVLNQGFSTHRY